MESEIKPDMNMDYQNINRILQIALSSENKVIYLELYMFPIFDDALMWYKRSIYYDYNRLYELGIIEYSIQTLLEIEEVFL